MGFLDSLGKVADWLPDVSVGQVVDVALTPVVDDGQLADLAKGVASLSMRAGGAVNDFGNALDSKLDVIPGYRLNKAITGGIETNILPALDKAWDQGTRPFSTLALQVKNIADGDFEDAVNPTAWKKAWRTSDAVTIGQASTLGNLPQQLMGRLADNVLSPAERREFYKMAPWLSTEFDPTDPRQREAAWRDSFLGKIQSGSNDLVARWYFDPANVVLLGGTKLKRLRDVKTGTLLTSTNTEQALAGAHTERVLDWIDNERALGGDIAARLHDHPALRRNSHGDWMATALADARTRDEARDVLGVLYGSDEALFRLQAKNAELADRIALRQMEAIDLEKVARIGDPEMISLGFDQLHLPERLKLVQSELSRMVTEEKLNERTLEMAKLFQGERALDFSGREAAYVGHVRHDVFQKGPSNRILRFVRPAVSMAPHKMVNVNRPNSGVQVERFLRQTQAPIDQQDELLEKYLRAVTPAERAMVLNDIEEKAVRYALRDLDEETTAAVLRAATKGRTDSMAAIAGAERRYAGNMAYSLVKVSDGTQEIHYPLFVTQTQDVVPMVDIAQLNRIVKRYSSTIKLLRDGNPGMSVLQLAPWLADRYMRLWKPATLLRPAWPIRVVGDEQLRIIGKLNGMTHASWRKLGVAELDYVQGQKVKAARDGVETLDPQDLVPRDHDPIDALYARGELTDDQFDSAALSILTADTHFAPMGYEDIVASWRRGDTETRDMLAQLKQAALLRNEGYYFDQSDVERFYDRLLEQDGLTVDINTGSVPTGGYAVSTRPDLSEVFDLGEFRAIGQNLLRDYVARNRTELLKPGRMLGAWVDEVDGTQVVYLDVSRVVGDRDTALEIGRLANQVSVADIDAISRGAWDDAFPNTGGDGTLPTHRPHASPAVAEEEWRRTQERIEHLAGGEPKPMDYDPLRGAYLGVSNWHGYDYSGAYGVGPEPNQFWDLSSSRGALHNLADHYERDGIMQANNRLRNWKAVEPGDAGYESAWEVAVNQQIAMDPMARQFLQGKSYDDVVAWLRGTKEGILHRKTLPVRGQNPEEWVGMVEDMVETYLPTERLRQLALQGTARHGDLVDEVGLTSLRPVVHGEALGTALGSGDFWQWYEKWTSKAFEKLGGMPTDHLSRHPYFATMYHAKIRQAIDTSINQGTEITPEMIGRLERMGREFALSETKKLLYDLAEQSDLARLTRFIAPFYGAWQETLTRWAGIAAENPVVLSRAHMIWDAPHKAGLVYDRQTGQPIYDPHSDVDVKDQVIRLRLPKWAVKDLPDWAEAIPGVEQAQWLATFGGNAEGVTLSKGGFNLITMGEPWWLPGVGPTVQIPVNELVKDKPELQDTAVGRYILPYGATSTGSTVGDALTMSLPSAYKRGVAIPQDEGNAVFGNMKLRIYTTEMVKFEQGLRPKKPTWKEATWKARQMFSVWALATWVSPTGIAPISPVEPYVVEYRALLAADATKDKNDPNYRSPDAIFLDRHGEELFALTGSLTKSANGAPATLGAYKATKRYAKEIQKVTEGGSPELAGLIVGSEGAGEFNYAVYQYQLNNDTFPGSGVKQRERLSPSEKLSDRAAAAGWIEYRKIMDQVEHERIAQGLPSLNVKEAEPLNFLKNALIENLRRENPQWGLDYDQVDRGTMRRRIVNLRQIIESNPQLRGRQDMQGVIEYLRLRDMVVRELRTREATTLTAQSNADLAFLFQTAVGNLVEKNLAFQDTYYRYLERDELSAKDRLGGE